MVHSVSGCTRSVQVKLWDSLRTHAIPERLRGVFTTRRYTNPRLPYFTLPDSPVSRQEAYTYVTWQWQWNQFQPNCWIFNEADVQQIDALDQSRLRRVFSIWQHEFVRNAAVCQIIEPPPISSAIKSQHLLLCGHVAHMNGKADANQI